MDNMPAVQFIKPLEPQEVMAQVQLIQKIMREVMKDGEHYGTIPGCGPKKVLLKAGAEKLAMTFRLCPAFEVKRHEYDKGHREYEVKCILKNMHGDILAEGVGSCSTMESKYRYRRDAQLTSVPVPKSYWANRDQAVLISALAETEFCNLHGQISTKKNESGTWFVSVSSKMENSDIADCYNTVLKMAKKRAQVDATITATAASDIFTQDIEEIEPLETIVDHTKDVPKKVLVVTEKPLTKSEKKAKADESDDLPASFSEIKDLSY